MSIKISVEKIIDSDGYATARITKIEGMLCKHELPGKYTINEPAVWSHADAEYIMTNITGYSNIKVGSNYSLDHILRYIDIVKKAGKHLHDVKKEIAKLKEEWKGTETYII